MCVVTVLLKEVGGHLLYTAQLALDAPALSLPLTTAFDFWRMLESKDCHG
eukprot:m.237500 g.237500  ORF g.237500 m.237500 type:complete len:50 (+) comp15269_c0_seq8:1783-1932(+)